MGKSSRFKAQYRRSASKYHKHIGDILKSSDYKNFKIYQEYPVNRINPSFRSGREKFDWVILDLKIVIEVHGQQHYMPVNFGGITDEEAERNFKEQRRRDKQKRKAAEEAGFTYIVISYKDALDIEPKDIAELISEAEPKYEEKPLEKKEKSEYHKERLKKAREYRKQAYQRMKEQRKNYERDNRCKRDPSDT